MTLDTNITIKYGGCRGMEPIIINGSGCHVGIEYLRRNYETAIKLNAQLLQLSLELQEQRDDALRSLDGADSIIEDQSARIEELEEALARIEGARIAQLEDYQNTIEDSSIYGQRM